jgi:hypothetical protein
MKQGNVKRRRVDVRRILAEPDLRRKLMVDTLQATQAREGVDTTPDQAERAYYVVTEGERAAFFDLEPFGGGKGQPDSRHEMFVRVLQGEHHRDLAKAQNVRFDIARRDFGSIDGSPFAYRRVGLVSHIFRDAPALEPGWGIAAQGLATAADDRFVRHWWEIPPATADENKTWVRFAKGGEFSRFYADVYLVVNWRNSGAAIRAFEGAYIRNEQHYFRPGLTWPRRTQRGFNLRVTPPGCVFADKGPAVFPSREDDSFFILGTANSASAEYLIRGLMSFGSWEVGVIKRLPIPQPTVKQHENISVAARKIYETKATWDAGNEISTRFSLPWLLNPQFLGDLGALAVQPRLDRLAEFEAEEDSRIQSVYAELNDEVYKLYAIPDTTRTVIEETLGDRPPEILWPQMEDKSVEQKRMEHVWRLLSYTVKRVVEADEDGVAPFSHLAGESSLLERVRTELARLLPDLDPAQVETEIVNELKKKVKGYRRTNSLSEWLDNVFFDYHCSLYKSRPILWHIASSQGTSAFAFGALVHYHKFDRNRMAKLRAQYLRESIDTCRREAALAERDSQIDARLEWQARLEEAQELDQRLQWVQEGHHEGAEGGDTDYRILTPWKSADQRPRGWDPDLDDGVKVNIEPLQKAGVLRVAKVV